ncbi:hydroxymethylglutaryl-CoA lyase [bacterium]|nr:hydroxymethylglutaryl-CoA lyase [bacterium]
MIPSAQIFEVGLRDGLQSEKRTFSLDEKIRLFQNLLEAGLKNIEIGSFVRSDRIAQLADTPELLQKAKELLKTSDNKASLWAFIPNLKGLLTAIPLGLDGASVFYSCSETFAQKNVNRDKTKLLKELKQLKVEIDKSKVQSRAYLSTIVHCPYEGEVSMDSVSESVTQLVDLGFKKIALSDTTGHATPLKTKKLVETLLKKHPASLFSLHMHDTRGLALANVWEGAQLGITEFDSSVAGLGGCPYAPGASGNLATEDLVYLFENTLISTGVDLKKLAKAGFLVESCLGRKLFSKVLRSLEGENVSCSS